jgi:hypothetical protein
MIIYISAAFPTVKYDSSKSTDRVIAHMKKFHSHDGLLWAIQSHTHLLAQQRQTTAVRTVADVHGSLLSFVSCYVIGEFHIMLIFCRQ